MAKKTFSKLKYKIFISKNFSYDVVKFLVVEEEPLLDPIRASTVSAVAGFSLASGILIQTR